MDRWGQGCYEETARELAPASEVAVAALGLTGAERVLDVGCGTANAALVADALGAEVVGLDSSPRLVEIARARLPHADFVVADAADLPFDDGEFDAAVSVFGVMFAQPGERAAAEIARVVRPGGRIAITTWPPRGPAFAITSLLRRAIARARPADGPPPVRWGDPAALESLLGPYGELEVVERQLVHEDTNLTPEELWERRERHHPMWVDARALLEPAGEWDALREASIAALREAGPPSASPYLLAILTRHGILPA